MTTKTAVVPRLDRYLDGAVAVLFALLVFAGVMLTSVTSRALDECREGLPRAACSS